MLWIVLGLVGILAGIVLMVLSHVILGVVVLLAGVVCMAVYYVTMMRGAGYLPGTNDPDGVPGHHESERAKMDQTVIGEQDPSIWEKMEQ